MSTGDATSSGLMSEASTFVRKLRRRALAETFGRVARNRSYRRVWIDVGAHEGESSFPYAAADPSLLVYAFEPNLRAAARVMGKLRNYVILPIAIAERDGSAELNLNAYEQSSSLLPADADGVKSWVTEAHFEVIGSVVVPTMRLDTFMTAVGLEHVDFLKVDAQGLDLEVVKSAGDRLRDVARVQLEATTVSYRQYEGAPGKSVIVEYMESKGFRLAGEEIQSHGQEANLTFVRV
ncbi:MAG TPA: FkbM family methyltransferase [Candidatus Limnocylindrales bacterium]|nr:FkbM family methyltransferase [Candidatus Limnocylindrales bacterium]